MEAFQQTLSDLNEMYRTLTLRDFALPTFIFIWMMVLAFPLKGIPRTDIVTGATYMLYGTATGIFLTIVLPNKLFGQTLSRTEHLLLFFVMLFIISIRWWLRSNTTYTRKAVLATPNSEQR